MTYLSAYTNPRRLPFHGGDATTLVVTIGIEQLREELATAGLIAPTVPGDSDGPAGDGDLITAAEARRLACSAKILPAVLGGASEVLDLADGVLLCSHHHHRAHDPAYHAQRLPKRRRPFHQTHLSRPPCRTPGRLPAESLSRAEQPWSDRTCRGMSGSMPASSCQPQWMSTCVSW